MLDPSFLVDVAHLLTFAGPFIVCLFVASRRKMVAWSRRNVSSLDLVLESAPRVTSWSVSFVPLSELTPSWPLKSPDKVVLGLGFWGGTSTYLDRWGDSTIIFTRFSAKGDIILPAVFLAFTAFFSCLSFVNSLDLSLDLLGGTTLIRRVHFAPTKLASGIGIVLFLSLWLLIIFVVYRNLMWANLLRKHSRS